MERDRVLDEILLLLPALSRGLGRPRPKELEEVRRATGGDLSGEGSGGVPVGGVSVGHVQVLISLARGPRSVGRIAEEIGVSAPAATQLVDRLVEHGMVERRHAETDRRVVMVDYVPRMHEVARGIVTSRKERLEEAISDLTDDEARAFLKGLKLLAGSFGAVHDASSHASSHGEES